MIDLLKQNDKENCIEMMKEFYNSSAVLHDVPQKFIEDTVANALANSPYVKIVMCKSGDVCAGYCNISLTFSSEVGGNVVLIEEIYVRENFQGKGLGTKMLSYVREKFDSETKRYRLEVMHDNLAAIKLYERLGFKNLDYKQMILDI